MINKQRLIQTTRQLIRINSENPPGDETKIAGFVQDYLKRLGLSARVYEFRKKRPNVLATLEGRNKEYSLLVTPHLDTVPAGKSWRFHPFSGDIRKGRIYGLGATDCKGNLGCSLEVIKSLVEDGFSLDYNLIFAATADEESGSGLGLVPLLDKGILHPDAAVVLDSDDFNIIVAQKGLLHLKIKIKGKRAHGAYPWLGINAIDIAMDVAQDLKSGYFFRYRKNKYLKPPTLNIGTIKGGDKVNVVADWCELELDFRFLPGMHARDIIKRIKGVMQKHTRRFALEITGMQKPYQIDRRHPLVEYFKKSAGRFEVKAPVKGSEGATTITFFQDKHIPAIATGFGCSGCAHIADEYVTIDNLYRGAKVLEEFLKTYRFVMRREQ